MLTAAAVLAALALAGCGSDSGIVKSVKTSGQGTGAAAATTPAATTHAAAPKPTRRPPPPTGCARKPVEHLITTPRWLGGFEITEYFSVPERWFVGRRVRAPGIPAAIASIGSTHPTASRCRATASASTAATTTSTPAAMPAGSTARAAARAPAPARAAGATACRAGSRAVGATAAGRSRSRWKGAAGRTGTGGRQLSYAGVTFAPGSSQPLHPYRTVAVDPDLIPAGSRLYIPAYKSVNGGWFVATDTGGAIIGRHIDVYRPPTGSIDDGGRYLTHLRVYVQPPGTG